MAINPQQRPAFVFVGGSYSAASLALDAQRTLNLYPETDATGRGKATAALIGTPGTAAFMTLPTSPIRGIYGATGSGRCFVVAGSKYYEVFSGGTYTTRGDVGNDGQPVSMWVDVQNHMMIVSAGWLWIDGAIAGAPGAYVIQAQYQNGTGTVSVAGTAVTWLSGSKFDASNVGQSFVFGGVLYYTVASLTDSTHLVLTASAGTLGSTYTGTCDVTGTAVTWHSGAPFDPATWVGTITIGGVDSIISQATSTTALSLTSAGATATGATFSITIGVPYAAFYPVAASCGAFLDGYSIVAKPGTKQINISSVSDSVSWNPIDFSVKQAEADGIVQLLTDHEELWIFGQETTEVWSDTGSAAFPLQRNASGFIAMGCVAGNTPCKLSGYVAWLGGDTRGQVIAYVAQGFVPVRVSTPAVESAWSNYSTVADAISYVYIDNGHTFWVISFPTAQATWVYDPDEKLWHERGWYNGASVTMQPQTFHGYVWGKHVVGMGNSGALLFMSSNYGDDAGVPITRQRAAVYPSNGTDWQFFHEFLLDIELNNASPAGTGLVYDYSDDGGQTFVNPRTASAATQAGSRGRVAWRRGGKTRGRVCRVTYTGGGKVAWIAAYANVEEGT